MARLKLLTLCAGVLACGSSHPSEMLSDEQFNGGPSAVADADPHRFGLVFGANEAYGADDIDRFADLASATGVKWMVVEARWSLAEPNPPSATPGPATVAGPRLGHHSYQFEMLDRIIFALTARGV